MTDALHLVSALARRVAYPGADEALPVRMCRAVVHLLGADGGALTCAPSDFRRSVVCTTDALADRLVDLEEVAGDGPGMRAFREGRSVGVVVGQHDDRTAFPLFSSSVAEACGPMAVRCWPVRRGGLPVALLTVYAWRTTTVPDTVEDGQVLADALGPVLGAVTPPTADPGGRARVDRAVGMVVAQTGLPPGDALALLRARAFASTSGVADVAAEVLARRLSFAQDRTAGL